MFTVNKTNRKDLTLRLNSKLARHCRRLKEGKANRIGNSKVLILTVDYKSLYVCVAVGSYRIIQ